MWDIAWNFGAPYAEEVNITQQLESMVANYLLCLAFNILYKGNYRHRYSCLYACSSTESARLVQSQNISDAEMANFFKGVITTQNLILHLTGQWLRCRTCVAKKFAIWAINVGMVKYQHSKQVMKEKVDR